MPDSYFQPGDLVLYNKSLYRIAKIVFSDDCFSDDCENKVELQTMNGTGDAIDWRYGNILISKTKVRFYKPNAKQKEVNLLLDIKEAEERVVHLKKELAIMQASLEKRATRFWVLEQMGLCPSAIEEQLKCEFPNL